LSLFNPTLLKRSGVPPKWSLSTQEPNYIPAEGLPRSMIGPDKCLLRQNLVDEPDPELRGILLLIRDQNHPLRNP
jgi:hypothetical protein